MKPARNIFYNLFSAILLLGLVASFGIHPANALTRNQLTIANLDTSQYPSISFYFWAFDGSGAFVKNVGINDAHILENKTVLAADSLEMLEPGVHFITVVNEGPTLANRYQMIARMDKVKEALADWAKAQPATSMDDFTLINNQGVIAYNQTKPSDWITTLNNYLPDLKKAAPGLAGLSSGIDQALTAGGATRKTPAILYVTPLPEDSQMKGLQDLISRAKSSDIRLFIWLIGPKEYAKSDKAAVLQQAAEQTNGEFFIFSGAETLPKLSTYLDPLKYVYKAVYTSAVKTSGSQTLSLQVRRQGITLDSQSVNFALNVMAPNPIFLSPPATITRSWQKTDKRNEYVLGPDSVEIKYLLEFPDGMARDLAYARLFVDNQMVAENNTAPYDVFSWDISQIAQSGTHQLKVIVEDKVGLKGETINVPVDVVVEEKPLTWFQSLMKHVNFLTVIPALLVITAGVLILLIGWKTIKRNMTTKIQRTHRLQDPVTQPVEIEGETVIHPTIAETPDTWPHLPGGGPAPARLVLLSSGKPEIQEWHEIPIGEFEFTLGSDATKVKALLNYPLVSSVHARIFMDENRQFRVADEGSASGTWLNYAPVSKNGAHLEHGDVLQFGKATFRFEQLGAETKKMRIIPLGDE